MSESVDKYYSGGDIPIWVLCRDVGTGLLGIIGVMAVIFAFTGIRSPEPLLEAWAGEELDLFHNQYGALRSFPDQELGKMVSLWASFPSHIDENPADAPAQYEPFNMSGAKCILRAFSTDGIITKVDAMFDTMGTWGISRCEEMLSISPYIVAKVEALKSAS